jgi:hypothetical protein
MKYFMITALLLLAPPAADFSGTWQGTVMVSMADGTKDSLPIVAYFKQNGAGVTGSLGPDEGTQQQISGIVKDNKLIFTIPLPAGNIAIELSLTSDGNHIKGMGKRPNVGETAIVELSRKAQ